jgi:hypothetical protein
MQFSRSSTTVEGDRHRRVRETGPKPAKSACRRDAVRFERAAPYFRAGRRIAGGAMNEKRSDRRQGRMLQDCDVRAGPALLMAAACLVVVVAALLNAW